MNRRQDAVRLIRAVDADPYGDVAPSVYETARVAALAPWLAGQTERIQFLLNCQRPDGGWGPVSAHALVPTLAAVEAAFTVLLRCDPLPKALRGRLGAAAGAGLGALRDMRGGPRPDTAAVELIVPDLVERINELLLGSGPADLGRCPHLGPWYRGGGIAVPPGYDASLPGRLGQQIAAADTVPDKLHHTFEALLRHCPDTIDPAPGPDGLLGSSPAATAAWLTRATDGTARRAAVTALGKAVGRYHGLCPNTVPITTYERLWVLAALLPQGLPPECLPTARIWLTSVADPGGVRGAPGLIPDADDTAMAVYTSILLGQEPDPAPLTQFENGTRYNCYPGEDTGSVTANAHVLRALGSCVRARPTLAAVLAPGIAKTRSYLLDRQLPDGSWTDKWHASPYYATASCALALGAFGDTAAAQPAVNAALTWVRGTQRDDGSWGMWHGTAEETAYALQMLLHAGHAPAMADTGRALDRARDYLDGPGKNTVHYPPALWQDKDLYAPRAMIMAQLLAATARLPPRYRNTGERRCRDNQRTQFQTGGWPT
ncbi:MAG: labda-7,13-dienyl diphosphate synthase [Pseudonocardiaceae bacterium]